MRRLALLCALFGCAHASRSTDPSLWLRLTTEHFVLSTDLPPVEAQQAAIDLEQIRSALLSAAWHSPRPAPGRIHVVELASDREMREFAAKGLEGFVAADAFEEPIMVVSADQEDQQIFKHELSHVITGGYLVSKPRWVNEGIACYLETLKLDRKDGKFLVGTLSRPRMQYLNQFPVRDYASVFHTGRDAEMMDQQAGYAFETASWLVVHFLVDTRPRKFDAFLNRLGRGEPADRAFQAEFPELDEAALRSEILAWWRSGSALISQGRLREASIEVKIEPMDTAEVHALRADLLRLSPGFRPSERKDLVRAEAARALAVDRGHPLALQLMENVDPEAAITAHPRDWRTWMLVADRKNDTSAIERAARLAPENPSVLARLAIAEINRGAHEEGLRSATRATELTPGRADVLDVLAQALAANTRCDDALNTEQRAIDALPDSAAASELSQLRKRWEWISVHCGQPGLERRIVTQPILKGCGRPMPAATARDHVDGAISAEFSIREDGTVADVAIAGSASAKLLGAMKKYLESCSFEATLDEGKPIAVKSSAKFTFTRSGGK